MTNEDRLTKATEGDTVKLTHGPYGDELAVPLVVKTGPSCSSNDGRWGCLTHNVLFDNQFQKDTHINRGRHRMVWICAEHGPEVP